MIVNDYYANNYYLFISFSISFTHLNINLNHHSIGNFTIPFLSWVTILVLTIICLTGVRFFLLFLLVNEFIKKFRLANQRSNCEPLNILLRSPDLDQLVAWSRSSWWWRLVIGYLKLIDYLYCFLEYCFNIGKTFLTRHSQVHSENCCNIKQADKIDNKINKNIFIVTVFCFL